MNEIIGFLVSFCYSGRALNRDPTVLLHCWYILYFILINMQMTPHWFLLASSFKSSLILAMQTSSSFVTLRKKLQSLMIRVPQNWQKSQKPCANFVHFCRNMSSSEKNGRKNLWLTRNQDDKEPPCFTDLCSSFVPKVKTRGFMKSWFLCHYRFPLTNFFNDFFLQLLKKTMFLAFFAALNSMTRQLFWADASDFKKLFFQKPAKSFQREKSPLPFFLSDFHYQRTRSLNIRLVD